eukprot:comp12215_c0_seq1/m.6989 comp12215_c0_seq1/g.6989  ORF comp12215_c0_seq1/g.6989 comp12215_c0_seq1/m.6989 type:complete len:105 (-) comp12215_c0_seq1:110-424(-)
MASQVKSLAQLSARIFGQTVAGNNLRNGFKYLREPLKGPSLLRWYPSELFTFHKLQVHQEGSRQYLNEWRLRHRELAETLRNRGKGPPKKGAGRRAQLAAKKKK